MDGILIVNLQIHGITMQEHQTLMSTQSGFKHLIIMDILEPIKVQIFIAMISLKEEQQAYHTQLRKVVKYLEVDGLQHLLVHMKYLNIILN